MLFNSLTFALFLPGVFFLYWFVASKNLMSQNLLLLVSSYFFYACWDWRFLFLLLFSTSLDYYTGMRISDATSLNTKRFWFWLSISVNLGFLAVFKYYDFFVTSFAEGIEKFGFTLNPTLLNVILPVGISFYTFHGLSYVIDIFNERIKPERNFVIYSLFVSFFPLLVAGPIERATHLLPQLRNERKFSYSASVEGLRQILWGMFKKVVIADNCAIYANQIFDHAGNYSGWTLVLGALFFTFQIYGDFSGYSDIALGTARLFGIDLLRNFAFPYFSRDIAEFWRRWHISLSSWFRDYLYIPLGGSKGSTWTKVRNTFIIFLVSGFWHGANWTFIVWGALNALYFLPLLLFNKNRTHLGTVAKGKMWPSFKEVGNMAITFSLTVVAWIFFRAENVHKAFAYTTSMLGQIFSVTSIRKAYEYVHGRVGLTMFVFLFIFLIVEWLGREQEFALQKMEIKLPGFVRWCFYFSIVMFIFLFAGIKQQFIYFQF